MSAVDLGVRNSISETREVRCLRIIMAAQATTAPRARVLDREAMVVAMGIQVRTDLRA